MTVPHELGHHRLSAVPLSRSYMCFVIFSPLLRSSCYTVLGVILNGLRPRCSRQLHHMTLRSPHPHGLLGPRRCPTFTTRGLERR
jgi:hypothetical protein